MNHAGTWRNTRDLIKRTGPEAAAFLASLILVMTCSQLLLARDETGLNRYELDQAAGRVSVAPVSMRQSFCQHTSGLGITDKTILDEYRKLTSSNGSVVDTINTRLLPALSGDQSLNESRPTTGTELQAQADRLHARYLELDHAMAQIPGQGVDWEIVSEGYAINPGNDVLKERWQTAQAALDSTKEAARQAKPLEQRFNRPALRNAFQARWGEYERSLSKAQLSLAATPLWQLSALLDGEGRSTAARSVHQLLNAERTDARAQQAEALIRYGGWLWLGWGTWLWLTIQVGRRADRPMQWAGVALLLAMGLAGVEQHWLGIRMSETFYWTFGCMGAAVFLFSRTGVVRAHPEDAQPVECRVAAHWSLLPGWILFVGLGWLLVADLSLHFHPDKRFLVVEHHVAVWWACILLGLVPLFRPRLIALLVWINSRMDAPTFRGVALGVFVLLALPGLAYLSHKVFDVRQYLTGEPIKAIAILYAAWFLLIRAPALKSGKIARSALSHLLTPALLAFLSIAIALIFTKDFGPLLVLLICALLYWCGAYFGVGRAFAFFALGLLVLFSAGNWLPDVIANRVASAIDPFSAATDDMARLIWFQRESPLFGFGLGYAPWCGYSAMEHCAGLPEQVQSDYTFTALTGVFGVGSWIVVLLVSLWFLILMRAHWNTSIAATDLLRSSANLREGYRAWLAIVFGTLLLSQLGVTVAGNVAWIPLTGITLPWMSFGTTALLMQTAFYALLADTESRHESK